MKRYYTRLNLELNDVQLDPSKLEPLQTYDKFQKYGVAAIKQFKDYGLHVATSYKATEEDMGKAILLLPDSVLDREVPEGWVLSMQDDGYLPAHVDQNRKCTINFYYEPHGEEATFYDYENRELKKVCSFVAQHGECYLFNTTQVHDVKLNPDHPRKVFGLTFKKLSYEELRELLQAEFAD